MLSDFKTKGFKPTSSTAKTRVKEAPGVTDKIRAIWHTMHREGFIQHDTVEAINGYVKRITHNSNGGAGIARWIGCAATMRQQCWKVSSAGTSAAWWKRWEEALLAVMTQCVGSSASSGHNDKIPHYRGIFMINPCNKPANSDKLFLHTS